MQETIDIALWQSAGTVFFIYVILVVIWRGLRGRAARLAFIGAAIGLTVILTAAYSGPPGALHDWIWPPVVLLIAYWTSGLLFVAPVPRQERALIWLDDRLAVRDAARRTPRFMAEVLEAAYIAIYPLIPFALLLRFAYSAHPDPPGFWSVILVTDFICFGVLPWVQTRPPRALELGEPWRSSIRRFNLRLLGAASIQVNTFPSGHAAEALAAALLILESPTPIVAMMFVAALSVAAGAILGRYHYALDALAGWAVAITVYALVG
jgi:hypothetical protein